MKITSRLLLLCAAFIVTGCMTAEKRLEQQAQSYGFSHQQLMSNAFLLTVFKNKPICNNNKLHIYIGGDGNPWLHHQHIAIDPTPNHLLVLDLMDVDKTPSLYLGRPCYHGENKSDHCHPLYWTHWRYSATVVDTMVTAIQQILVPFPGCSVSLIGYSGGGTLAMLIAAKLSEINRVITVSGNLDVNAWTRHHQYSHLDGSLDPAREPALPSKIVQIHLIGENDQNIPAEIVIPALGLQPDPVILRLTNADHACCWASVWADVLQLLSSK